MTSTDATCPGCDGTGDCQECADGNPHCDQCDGTGECPECDGSGETEHDPDPDPEPPLHFGWR